MLSRYCFIITLSIIPNLSKANFADPDSLIIPIANFTSLAPSLQNSNLHLPNGFNFQKIAQFGETMHDGNTFSGKFDFTGYVPINNSNENGYLSVSHEEIPGGVSIMDLVFDKNQKRWARSLEKKVDFSTVVGTIANCSGAITPWNTLITCEEFIATSDVNNDGYYDTGWAVEIDPVSRTIVGNQKLWALGNFKHENLVVHANERTVYQGADSSPGYLFKFVANEARNLNEGKLYVYKGSKNGSGNWLLLANSTPQERNSTIAQSANLSATIFAGIEDVEISPVNSWVYLAVKGEGTVYRFQDSDPLTGLTITQFETFVGGAGVSYNLSTNSGSYTEAWGSGNDNLAFDNIGNLWVLQDGVKNFLWVVGKDHSQVNADVRIFMKTPAGSEPTGITFSPDNRFLFMSIQHPSSANVANQSDVQGITINFNTDIALVISRNEHWGIFPCPNELTVPNQIQESGFYQSQSHLTSQAIIQGSKILDYRAKEGINLNPGFIVKAGNVFLAQVKDCVN